MTVIAICSTRTSDRIYQALTQHTCREWPLGEAVHDVESSCCAKLR